MRENSYGSGMVKQAPGMSGQDWAILLLLSLVSATQLLSAYLRGWGSVVGSLFPKKE